MATGSCLGTIKSFNPQKGWGFIECEQTKQIYGQDVFLLKADLHGFGVSKGDQVTFTVKQSPKGIQAADVKVLVSPESQLFYGEVKAYNPQKGFGFISGPASEQLFGKDVFVMKSELSGAGALIGPGTQVQFKAKMGERGPVATEVQVLLAPALQAPTWPVPWPASIAPWLGAGCGGPAAAAALLGQPALAPFAAQLGGSWAAGAVLPGAVKAPSENEVFFGVLKKVNAEKGWGHITSEAMQKIYGKDIFVLRSSFETVQVYPGQQVCFSVSQGPKGPHATNIRPFNAVAADTVFTGVVKSFNDTKGWGFIESPMAKAVFMTDIFLHKKDLGGVVPRPGDQLQFKVDVAGGRAAAKNVIAASAGRQGIAVPHPGLA